MKKLTSRKFLSALAGMLIGVAEILGGEITSGSAVVVASILGYLVVEGIIDLKAIKKVIDVVDEVDELLDEESEAKND